MGVGWIDNIYNNTDSQWYLRSVDSSHNGVLTGDGGSFPLDDLNYHALTPKSKFHAQWCGIPWYYQGSHYKAMSLDKQKNVQFYTSQSDGTNWIYFLDGLTGNPVARQKAPKSDFHCNLRFEDDGNYIDIVNDDGSTVEAVTFVYNESKFWADEAIKLVAALIKKIGGGN